MSNNDVVDMETGVDGKGAKEYKHPAPGHAGDGQEGLPAGTQGQGNGNSNSGSSSSSQGASVLAATTTATRWVPFKPACTFKAKLEPYKVKSGEDKKFFEDVCERIDIMQKASTKLCENANDMVVLRRDNFRKPENPTAATGDAANLAWLVRTNDALKVLQHIDDYLSKLLPLFVEIGAARFESDALTRNYDKVAALVIEGKTAAAKAKDDSRSRKRRRLADPSEDD